MSTNLPLKRSQSTTCERSVPTKQSEISAQFEILNNNITSLEHTISLFRERFKDVLKNFPCEPRNKPEQIKASTIIGLQLQDISEKLAVYNYALNEIIEDCGL